MTFSLNAWNLLWIVPTVISTIVGIAAIMIYFGELVLFAERQRYIDWITDGKHDKRVIGPYTIIPASIKVALDNAPRHTVYDSLMREFLMPDGSRVPLELVEDNPELIHKNHWQGEPSPLEYMKMGAGLSAIPATNRRMRYRGNHEQA